MEGLTKMLPWIVAVIIIGGVAQVVGSVQRKRRGEGAGHRYKKCEALMSPGELKFFRVLEAAVGG